MNTIERKLLSITHPNVDITLLEEIIDATPNPTVATEILCGLYQAPEIPANIWKDSVLRTKTWFNKWNGQVQYSYERPKVITDYFPAGTKQEDITAENYRKLSCSYNDEGSIRISTTIEEVEVKNDSMSLDQWMKYHAAIPYVSPGKVKQMEYENMYADDNEVEA